MTVGAAAWAAIGIETRPGAVLTGAAGAVVGFPELQPNELVAHLRQGAAEPWFDREWRPFWSSLDAEQREHYLQPWSASLAWREAMSVFDVEPDLDLEADARESEQYLRDWAEQRASPAPWWRGLLQRKR